MYRFPSAAREQKKKRNCRQSSGTQREVHHKPENTATAIIDDERGPFLIGHACKQRRELTSGSRVHNTREIVEILPKASLDDANMYTVEPSIAHPRETATAELHSFLRAPTRAPVAAQQQARNNHARIRTAELRVPRSACSWNVHPSVDELKYTRVHEQKPLELMLHVHRDSARWPVFISRPGLAVETHIL